MCGPGQFRYDYNDPTFLAEEAVKTKMRLSLEEPLFTAIVWLKRQWRPRWDCPWRSHCSLLLFGWRGSEDQDETVPGGAIVNCYCLAEQAVKTKMRLSLEEPLFTAIVWLKRQCRPSWDCPWRSHCSLLLFGWTGNVERDETAPGGAIVHCYCLAGQAM